MTSLQSLRSLRLFRDDTGRVVIAQAPNLPILGWLVCAIVARLLDAGQTRWGLEHLSRAFLFTWAYLEITSGVNWFRRALGAVVMVGVVMAFFRP